MNYDSVPLRDFKELNDWETVMFVYQSALKQINTKIDILNDEFQHRHKYNPIEHVKSRIKTPESIVNDLRYLQLLSRRHCEETETSRL